MKGVILAAGKGTRMRRISHHIPKPLLPIANRPMLEHTISAMVEAGVPDIVLVVSFKHEMIRRHLGDGDRLGARISYILQEKPLGTGHALMITEQHVRGDQFLMVFGDIMTPARNIRNIVDRFRSDRPQAMLSVHRVGDPYRGAAVYIENSRVVKIIEKPPRGTSTTNFDNAGVFVLGPEVFDMLRQVGLSPRGEYELTDIFSRMVEEKKDLRAFELEGYWHNVSSPEELVNTNRSMIEDALQLGSEKIDPSARVAAPEKLSDLCLIGPGCRIEKAVIACNVSIGAGTRIGPDCTIENAIIDRGADIGAGSTIKNAIILRNARISANSKIIGATEAVQFYV